MGAGLCACGIELQVGPGDGSADGGTSSSGGGSGDDDPTNPNDAGPVVRRCDPDSPLSAPEEVPGITPGQSAGQPRLSADETQLYFARVIDNVWHVLHASRPDVGAGFQNETVLTGIEAQGFEHYWPSISGDGLTLSYSRFNGGGQEILDSRRDATDAPFTPGAVLAADALLLFRVPDSEDYFYSRYDGRGQQTITYGTADSEAFLFPDHPGQDLPLWYEPAAQLLWFKRDGVQHTAARSGDAFASPSDAARLGASIEISWVSPDGCRLYGSDSQDRMGTLKMQRRASPP